MPLLMPVVPPEPPEQIAFDIRPRPRSLSYSPQRSPGIAAVLSFFWPGVGQIYNGEIGKGLVMFVLNVAGSAFAAALAIGSLGSGSAEVFALVAGLVFLLLVPYWIFCVYDAYCRAQALNYRGR